MRESGNQKKGPGRLGASWIMGLAAIMSAAGGCADLSAACGPGTVEIDGQCVVDDDSGDDDRDCVANDANEPNDAPLEATNPDRGQRDFVGLCPGDEDWFVAAVPAGYTLLVTLEVIAILSGDPLQDVRLEVMDPNGEVLASAVVLGDELELTYKALGAEAAFVRVSTDASDEGFIYDMDLITIEP